MVPFLSRTVADFCAVLCLISYIYIYFVIKMHHYNMVNVVTLKTILKFHMFQKISSWFNQGIRLIKSDEMMSFSI